MATKIAHGTAGQDLADYCGRQGIETLLVIASQRAWRQSGLAAVLESCLPDLRLVLFSEFSPNPTFEEVQAGIAIYHQYQPQAILGLGGGSAIDIAKSVAVLTDHSETAAKDCIKQSAYGELKKNCPLVVVPTTAGSGSEATHFAVVYLDGKKYSVAAPCMLPDLSLVDGQMSYSMGRELAASCGMDALCQAMESYWAVNATPESQEYARQAIKILVKHLAPAVLHRREADCDLVAEAACLAGQAINISKTTAAHAYSYYLTSHHGISHGHAVSLCFPAIAQCNFYTHQSLLSEDLLVRRFTQLFAMVGVENIEGFVGWFNTLLKILGLETDLAKLGIHGDQELAPLLASVNIERMTNNPAVIDSRRFGELLFRE